MNEKETVKKQVGDSRWQWAVVTSAHGAQGSSQEPEGPTEASQGGAMVVEDEPAERTGSSSEKKGRSYKKMPLKGGFIELETRWQNKGLALLYGDMLLCSLCSRSHIGSQFCFSLLWVPPSSWKNLEEIKYIKIESKQCKKLKQKYNRSQYCCNKYKYAQRKTQNLTNSTKL